MTKCIYCGQYGEQYKSCAFCGAPHVVEKRENIWQYPTRTLTGKSYMSEVKVPHGGLVNIRTKPSYKGKIVGHLPVGSQVSPQEFREGWIKIEKNQWVKESYVSYPIAYGRQL